VEAVTTGRPLPPRATLVTFDDAYRDFAENAWPVLKREGIPTILFVSTAYPGDASRIFWWDALHQMLGKNDSREVTLPGIGTLGLDGGGVKRVTRERLRSYLAGLGCSERDVCLEQLQHNLGVTPERKDSLLTWEDLSRLADEGLAVAPHTHSHTILARLPAEQIAREVQMSRLVIRQQIGQDWPIFCYPNGRSSAFNRDTSRILEENGYAVAFTMICGVNFVGRTPPLEMHRIGMDYQDSLPVLHLRLAALHRYKRSSKQTQRAGALEVA
jgi:peptidoglycan/xylan/chitin deacetylase (PgdA/CDA1 family)